MITMAIYIQNHYLRCDTHNDYTVFFYGNYIHTTVTSDPITVSDWISTVKSTHHHRNRVIVGLDVEWQPSYSRHQNPVATVQLCVGTRCLVYQIIHSPYVPAALADFLSDGGFTFAGVGVNSDLRKLADQYGIGMHARAVELGSLAAREYGREEMNRAGLKELARVVLAAEVEKPRGVTMSNWANRSLTNEQVQYACVDAYVSAEIGRRLNASD